MRADDLVLNFALLRGQSLCKNLELSCVIGYKLFIGFNYMCVCVHTILLIEISILLFKIAFLPNFQNLVY